ncbi:type II toxin-antitoxin system VapC family toxin [Uliginosibacterium aquaticum]|uniref:Type II toxin-antitoxin system VapC family toxin n=1 Tax=Uliginosibacterium aquaticum TaxID=2731212 RepID=A0ABX2IKP5_9RHOO|nr:type II toxin-antitoxin system VapC family toxin [Uliginosibacterium aquaticum]NSL57047.1 type II toxin-antitoxin system VapC family toxin [Uliginosibacterium aquaticum]
MAISSIMLAERAHGAEKGSQVSRNLTVVEDFCSRLAVPPHGEREAHHYGGLRAAPEKTGQPIGANDLHRAAHARAQGLTLISNNLREFERAPGLLPENRVSVPRFRQTQKKPDTVWLFLFIIARTRRWRKA